MKPRKSASLVALRLLTGGILCAAGVSKLGAAGTLAHSISNYQLLPSGLVPAFAVLLPWWETTIGLLLLAGVWIRASAVLALLVSAGFSASVMAALVRGLDIECGCFGGQGAMRAGIPTLLLDLFLAGAAVILLRRTGFQTG